METPAATRIPPPVHRLRQQPGGLRGGLPVLRNRAHGAAAQLHGRRDRRPGSRRRSALHRRGLGPVTHIVYMGMGEPLANAAATLESLHVLTAGAGHEPASDHRLHERRGAGHRAARGGRHARDPCRLAPRGHRCAARSSRPDQPNVPARERCSDAASRYVEQSGRRISFEWCLIGGVNDSIEQAEGLRDLARRAQAHINVIPMNRIEGSPWGPPEPEVARRFLGALRGARVTVRDTRGGDADAACGQLRADLEARRMLRPDGTLSPPRVPARA